MDEMDRPSFPEGQRVRILLHALVAAASLLAILVMVNYLAARHPVRVDVTRGDRFGLSPLTIQTLRLMTNEIRITLLFQTESDLYSMVEGLLRRYAEESPLVKLERIDPNLSPGRSTLLRDRLNLAKDDNEVVVFESGKEVRVVRDSELSVYDADLPAMMAGKTREVRRSAFKGEALFTSAIVAVTQAVRPKVHFLHGHGEHDPRSNDSDGFQKFMGLLTERNADVQLLTLDGVGDAVPADCQLIVVAGPRRALSPQAVQRIDDYLGRGGRLLVLLNASTVALRTGLEDVLFRWGIVAKASLVKDEKETTSREDVLVSNFGGHPIVNPLAHDRLRLQVWTPRVIGPVPDQKAADAPRVEVLLWTSESGRTHSRIRDGAVAFSPDMDMEGRIPLAAAAEKGGITGVAANRGVTRIVAAGDSTFLTNAGIEAGANRDFASLALAWLLDQAQFIQIGPKPVREYTLRLTPSDMTRMKGLFLAVLPGGVLLVGFVVWLRRRS